MLVDAWSLAPCRVLVCWMDNLYSRWRLLPGARLLEVFSPLEYVVGAILAMCGVRLQRISLPVWVRLSPPLCWHGALVIKYVLCLPLSVIVLLLCWGFVFLGEAFSPCPDYMYILVFCRSDSASIGYIFVASAPPLFSLNSCYGSQQLG
jgi:hypothetical protein